MPLEKLYRNVTGFSLAQELAHIREMDMFFLNEDRHTDNIALIYRQADRSYRLCPYFDMGLSLYADTGEKYPLDMDVETCRKRVMAKPFSQDFDEQMDAGSSYGSGAVISISF